MLRIEQLSKYFRGVHALDGVNVEFRPAEVVAIVGDNGAGKSTLMKCVAGALNPDSGTISFNGLNLSGATPSFARAAGIEMIYQDLGLCRMQDVMTNIYLGRELQRLGILLDRSRMKSGCIELCQQLGSDLDPSAIVGTLSGGQQQLVAVARAMISNPKFMIMDEPTAALAVKETQRVLKTILELKSKGVTVVIITHRLVDAFEVADRILVMQHGKIKDDLIPSSTDMKDLTLRIVEG